MQALLILFFLPWTIASLQEVLAEANEPLQVDSSSDEEKFIESFKNTNYTAMHEGMEELRHHLLQTLNEEESDEDKTILEADNNNPHHPKYTHLNKAGDSIDEINERNRFSEDLYQSDMILTPHQIDEIIHDNDQSSRARRQAFKDDRYPTTLWTNNEIFYKYDSSISSETRIVIEKAMKFWQDNTCLTFRYGSPSGGSLRFFRGVGCYSYIGNTGRGVQDVSIGNGCDTVGIVAHELGHALGFFHSQSRHDRDNFITLNTQNMKTDWLDQFNRETPERNYNYEIGYDYGSIMHYPGNSASHNKLNTMIARDPRYQETMGSPKVAFYDVLMMNKHYNCTAKCSSNSVKCENGGYPHPRDCSKCQCPGGFAGKRCTERPPGCGEMLMATSSYQSLNSSIIGSGIRDIKLDFDECNYIIRAPSGKRVEVKVGKIVTPACMPGCPYGGIEIKGIRDMRMTGYRYCCAEQAKTVVTSPHNAMMVMMYNKVYNTGIELEYRYVDGGSEGPVFDGMSPQVSTQSPPTYDEKTTTPSPSVNCNDSWRSCYRVKHLDQFCEVPEFKKVCAKSCEFCVGCEPVS